MLILSSIAQNIYISSCVIIGIFLIMLFVFPAIYKKYERTHFIKTVYKKVYKMANYYDYYLINNYPIKTSATHTTLVDHFLFTNKYIYAIKDRYYDTPISAKLDDEVWLSYSSSGTKKELNNPIMLNNARIDKFSLIEGIDRNFIISIIVVNDDAFIEQSGKLNSYNSFICKRKDLKRVILDVESRDVSQFDAKMLDRQVKELWKKLGRSK